jgi:hypothetical protein
MTIKPIDSTTLIIEDKMFGSGEFRSSIQISKQHEFLMITHQIGNVSISELLTKDEVGQVLSVIHTIHDMM